MRKRDMSEDDENDVADMSGYAKSAVRLAWFGLNDRVSVLLHPTPSQSFNSQRIWLYSILYNSTISS
jgi:hypothetical protein